MKTTTTTDETVALLDKLLTVYVISGGECLGLDDEVSALSIGCVRHRYATYRVATTTDGREFLAVRYCGKIHKGYRPVLAARHLDHPRWHALRDGLEMTCSQATEACKQAAIKTAMEDA